jgi:hypothetical protein
MEEENKQADAPKTRIEEARELAERIEKANAEHKVLLEREEHIRADRLLAGEASAGQIPVQPKEETAKEYAERISRGQL